MADPIELYYWPTPNGFKITMMLEECGLPYEVKYVNIGIGEQFEPDVSRRFRPTTACRRSSIPMAQDGAPISIFESGAILQYLGRKTGQVLPPGRARPR